MTSSQRIVNVGLTLLFLGLVVSGVKTFSLWQQVLDMLYNNPVDVLASMHPHALRFIVVFPFMVLAEILGLPQDYPFSIFVGFLIVLIGVFGAQLSSVVLTGSRGSTGAMFPWVFIPIAVLSMAMNGRIALAMCGITLIVALQTAHAARLPGNEILRAIGQGVGLFLASVSSGTIVIAFLMIVGFHFVGPLGRWPFVERRDLPGMVLGALFAAGVVPTIIVGFFKNLNYFGGGLLGLRRMLEHGAGSYLPQTQGLLVVLALALGTVVFVTVGFAISMMKQRHVGSPLIVGVVAALCGGAFGFSTLASASPLFLVALYVLLIERSRKRAIDDQPSPNMA